MSAPLSRLRQQIDFILETDRLKQVLRQSYILDEERRENSAEHSWQLALMAVLLCEHANESIDTCRVVKMLLLHDVVEVDAGDTYVYDTQGYDDKAEREAQAADRLFGLLPTEQGRELRALWEEFEARETPEARFAAALDRLMPILLNVHTQGRSWREHGITLDQVVERNHHMAEGSRELWKYAEALLRDAVEQGYLKA